MKTKWNDKTKRIAVITVMVLTGVGAVAGISACLHKDTAQAAEIEDISQEQDESVIILEDFQSGETDSMDGSEEELIISTEISEDDSMEKNVQSIQETPVKTEENKPSEAPEEIQQAEESLPDSQPENINIPSDQPESESKSSGSPQHGDVADGKIYIDGFGWIDYNGGETNGVQADNIYENGNKVGIMD